MNRYIKLRRGNTMTQYINTAHIVDVFVFGVNEDVNVNLLGDRTIILKWKEAAPLLDWLQNTEDR